MFSQFHSQIINWIYKKMKVLGACLKDNINNLSTVDMFEMYYSHRVHVTKPLAGIVIYSSSPAQLHPLSDCIHLLYS